MATGSGIATTMMMTVLPSGVVHSVVCVLVSVVPLLVVLLAVAEVAVATVVVVGVVAALVCRVFQACQACLVCQAFLVVILEVEEIIRDEFKIFNDKKRICFQIDKMAFARD